MTAEKKKSRLLNSVEWLGNALPHPVFIFIILTIILMFISAIGQYFQVSVPDPRPEGAKGRNADGIIYIVSLLDADSIRKIFSHMVTNFTGFAPLGTVLVSLLGVGIAERAGLISAALRLIVMKAPPRLTTMAVVFAGIMSNTASELGYVVLIPLSAILFHSLGRHPLAGVAAAFAGVSGGYSANLLLGTIDPLLSGITQQAAQIISPDYIVGAEANWYFMFASTFLITILGYLITEKIVEPQLGEYHGGDMDPEEQQIRTSSELTHIEKKALCFALFSFLVLSFIVAMMVVPEGAILRNQQTGLISNSPFLKSIVAFIFIFFSIPGIVYGYVAGTIRNNKDIVDAMAHSMSTLGLYLVIIFFASQFVAFFGWSNIGQVLAVKGGNFLNSLELHDGIIFLGFILICAFINLMIGSASAQWAVTAPIFVPMLMLAGYAPETIQAAYRIGDSVTNIITPMMSYFGLVMAIVIKYRKDAGIGTLVSMMLPYSFIFLVGWSLFFIVWVFIFDFPVGPGSLIYYP
ncbi:TPA: AbgT family transporter [Escherichia coli]|nr:AbgT family transporter [Escherichia coli]